MNLSVVKYQVLYQSKDITKDISDQILSIQYVDKIEGESDTLEITLEDRQQRWKNAWYPVKGDLIQLFIMDDSRYLDCGTFTVDELGAAGSVDGDTFSINAIAAGVNKALRTKNSYAHEDKTLREIASVIATKHGLTILGDVPEIAINRVTQYRETDLSFLNRLGSGYGCIFSIRDKTLVFTHYEQLRDRKASLTFTKQDLISYDLKDTTHKTFKKAKVKHHDPDSKDDLDYDIDDGDEDSEDDLEIRERVENKQQAEAKGKYALFKNNTAGVGGDISIPGNLLFLSGNNVQINGLGELSGIYQINESTHTISQDGGYGCSGNIKRIKTIDKSLFVTK